MKAGGLLVGMIILLGIGGREAAHRHVQETADLLNEMPLDQGDMIYFSELVISEGLLYARDAQRAGLTALTAEDCRQQRKAISDRLRFPAGGAPRMSTYDIREFIY
jgi:hypothetical protein